MKMSDDYVRRERLTNAISQLEQEGSRDRSVPRVDAIGVPADIDKDRLWLFRNRAEKHPEGANVEIVAEGAEVNRFVGVIRETSCSAERVGGRIFSMKIERTINIRTGEEGEAAI